MYMYVFCADQAKLVQPDLPVKQAVWSSDRLVPPNPLPHWLQAMLFEPDLCVQSRHHNLVAFHFELALMLRVIKAATTNGADRTQVKLAMRSLGGPGGQPCGHPA